MSQFESEKNLHLAKHEFDSLNTIVVLARKLDEFVSMICIVVALWRISEFHKALDNSNTSHGVLCLSILLSTPKTAVALLDSISKHYRPVIHKH